MSRPRAINSCAKTKGSSALVSFIWVSAIFLLLAGSVRPAWRDLLVASNQLVEHPPIAHETVFVAIDDSFLDPDVPLAMQFKHWAQLIEQIEDGKPAVILLDYQFSPRRFEKLLPGQAEYLEALLIQLSKHGSLVLGIAPQTDGELSQGQTLKGLEEAKGLKKGCMELEVDSDQVIRNFQRYAQSPCASSNGQTLAAVAAEFLGANLHNSGLILPRGVDEAKTIKASSLLTNSLQKNAIHNAIVVIGSGFPNEDELLASHRSSLVFMHSSLKGGLIHGLTTTALIENRIAWDAPWFIKVLLLMPAAFILLYSSFMRSPARWLWIGTAALLAVDLVSVNLLHRYTDSFVAATFWFSGATLLTGRKMLSELWAKRQIQSLLGGLLSPAVLSQYLNTPSALLNAKRYQEASVLVLDIQGYSKDAQLHDAETLYEKTNLYLAACTEIVHQYGGCIERFRGDGLLAYFGAPIHTDSPVDLAIDVAMEILKLSDNPDQPDLMAYQQRIRIGISAGELVLGLVGDTRRFDIAVTGLAANRASHFEGAADPVRYPIVIDQASLALAKKNWFGHLLSIRHPKHTNVSLVGMQARKIPANP